ncbi:MAG TPA: ABC transporter ATP-binding protein [Baekduia sp.]|uniref:ABC transporter ATP-binding protein n=1 Tax=Baekduia sp. TaxID=2600305 RepID=UPI002D77D680|nr:ABC transporter ATP-binding protein [Baekduia sp.]HET6508084.1 ABC transporter ATP-binding protein [Baekduia sp.]
MSGRALLPVASGREAFALLRALLGDVRRPALVGVLALLGATIAGLAVPALLGVLVDVVVDGTGAGAVTAPVLGLVAAAIAQALLTAVGARQTAVAGETVLARLRERVVDRALALPEARVEAAGVGDLVSRVGNDVETVSGGIRDVLPSLIRAGLLVVLTVVGLAALDWRLALAACAALPLEAVGVHGYLRRVVPLYARVRVAEGERTQRLVGALGAARTVRALGLREPRMAEVDAASRAVADLALEASRRQAYRLWTAVNGAELVGLSAVLVVGFLLVRSGDVTVGAATAAALYFHRAFDPVAELLLLVDQVQQAATALTRLAGVARLPAPAAPRADGRGDGSVVIAGVGHEHVPGRAVLADVALDVAPGERVAVVGESGAGKTTLARIVAGSLTPTRGDVVLGGVPVAAARRGKDMALVTQEVHVFAGPLAADLRLAAPEATEQELHDALALVGADGWASALPDGLETVVGDGGHALTALQAQQLALARLVLRGAPVVVLDEATAEAGSAGARVLERAARAVLDGRTALVVAHRLTQARTADRIVVLDAGRVVEVGDHDALLAADGRYAALWSAWSAPRDELRR